MPNLDFIRQPPAYLEYPTDLLGHMNYRLMSLAERGLFHTLRLELWIHGSLPADTDKLAVIIGVQANEVQKLFSDHFGAFFEIRDGFITCPELLCYRAKIERQRKRQAEGGSVGGKKAQERLRELQGNPEGNLQSHPEVLNRNALSRKGLSRDELNRDAKSNPNLTDSQRKWVEDYAESQDWE
jgi:hypothetical protein